MVVREAPRGAPRLQELREPHDRLEIARPQGLTELLELLAQTLGVAVNGRTIDELF